MKIFRRCYLFFAYLFLYGPIFVMIGYSFNDTKLRGVWAGFTGRWYLNLFQNQEILTSFYYTLITAVVATLISVLLGTITSLGYYFLKKPHQAILMNLNQLPVFNPDIVTAIGLMSIYQLMHLRLGLFTLILSHVVFCTPYVILSILPKLKQLNPRMIEASLDLGATPLQTLTKVVIYQIKPGILSGALMSFTLSLDDFVISFFTTGSGVSNLSVSLYSMAKKGIDPSMYALSTIMLVLVFSLLFIINKKFDGLHWS